MAKDGTMRGGPRPGTGPKKKALADKISEGKAAGALVLEPPDELVGVEMPPVKDYMKQAQKGGKTLCAEDVYKETWNWLRERGCEKLVIPQLIEQYAMSVARWIAVEVFISDTGYLARHPITGNAIASPYVSMSRDYMKQVNQIWYQIYQVVRENCAVEYGGASPQDNLMERLLQARKG